MKEEERRWKMTVWNEWQKASVFHHRRHHHHKNILFQFTTVRYASPSGWISSTHTNTKWNYEQFIKEKHFPFEWVFFSLRLLLLLTWICNSFCVEILPLLSCCWMACTTAHFIQARRFVFASYFYIFIWTWDTVIVLWFVNAYNLNCILSSMKMVISNKIASCVASHLLTLEQTWLDV